MHQVVTDLELLLTDDLGLGRRAAEAILATDVSIQAALYALHCQDGATRA